MNLDEFFQSPEFQKFLDEDLRQKAIGDVEVILKKGRSVKRSQLHSIPAVIAGDKFNGILKLAEKQKSKNSKETNKEFWTCVHDLISASSHSPTSLYQYIKSKLREIKLIEPEDLDDKKEAKQARKRNNSLIKSAMDRVLDVYFEHFNCHYFYKTMGGNNQ